MSSNLPLDFRLSRLTVESLRNLCDAQGVSGDSNLLKEELIGFVQENIGQQAVPAKRNALVRVPAAMIIRRTID